MLSFFILKNLTVTLSSTVFEEVVPVKKNKHFFLSLFLLPHFCPHKREREREFKNEGVQKMREREREKKEREERERKRGK